MRKKALCVGINDYPYNGADLNGCVSDARAWASLLIDHYDFQSLDVKLLTDNQATKSKIIEELKSLTAGTETGDVLFFSISSHGTYLSDAGGDETGYAEAFCPYDCANDLIMIEEVYDIFKDIVKSVHLTIVLDTSFSGTVTRSGISEFIPGLRTPDDRRVRFLSPALMGTRVLINPWKAQPKKKTKCQNSKVKEVLLSGCTDREYSYEALIDGVYHGAMTYFALKAIREANYKITYAQLIKRLHFLLDNEGYNQHPQLEGKTADKKRQIFA